MADAESANEIVSPIASLVKIQPSLARRSPSGSALSSAARSSGADVPVDAVATQGAHRSRENEGEDDSDRDRQQQRPRVLEEEHGGDEEQAAAEPR